MTRITDEAVDAVVDVLMDDGHNGIECRPDRNLNITVRAALEAALPHLEGATPAIDRDTLQDLLFSHYYDAGWSREHQGFRCVCGWLGEDHVSHVTDEVLALIGGTS